MDRYIHAAAAVEPAAVSSTINCECGSHGCPSHIALLGKMQRRAAGFDPGANQEYGGGEREASRG